MRVYSIAEQKVGIPCYCLIGDLSGCIGSGRMGSGLGSATVVSER